MMFNTDRIRATHTGSLPPPESLTQLMYDVTDGKDVDAAVLHRAESEAIAAVVGRQRESGISIVSDGESSKPGYALPDALAWTRDHTPAVVDVLVTQTPSHPIPRLGSPPCRRTRLLLNGSRRSVNACIRLLRLAELLKIFS
jgi:hypothetical protein